MSKICVYTSISLRNCCRSFYNIQRNFVKITVLHLQFGSEIKLFKTFVVRVTLCGYLANNITTRILHYQLLEYLHSTRSLYHKFVLLRAQLLFTAAFYTFENAGIKHNLAWKKSCQKVTLEYAQWKIWSHVKRHTSSPARNSSVHMTQQVFWRRKSILRWSENPSA